MVAILFKKIRYNNIAYKGCGLVYRIPLIYYILHVIVTSRGLEEIFFNTIVFPLIFIMELSSLQILLL